MKVIEVAKRFNLLEGTAYTYLTFMAEMRQVRRTGEVGDNNRQLWAMASRGRSTKRDKAGIVAQEGRTPFTFHEIRSLS